MRILIALVFVITGLAFAAPAASAQQSRLLLDYDCADFANQSQAQKWLLPGDPHRLDADRDAKACDSLPCPCSYSSSQKKPVPFVSTAKKPRKKAVKIFRERAVVVWVVDGDTVDVRIGKNKKRRVRIVGIDTPEAYGPFPMCNSSSATANLRQLLPVGTRVRLVSDPTQAAKDRYKRLLRYVTRAYDGLDTGGAQVSAGHARTFVYGGVPYQRHNNYSVWEASARASNAGVWGCPFPFRA